MGAPAISPAAPRERPLLMSGPLVLKALAGLKTQTRRPVKVDSGRKDDARLLAELLQKIGVGHACPYGVPGDRLWVRETWYCDHCFEGDYTHQPFIDERLSRAELEADWRKELYFRADGEPEFEDREGFAWRPSIHMPRWASRLTLEVTEVRVERLQEISAEDCIAEGFSTTLREHDAVVDLRQQFAAKWNEIYGPNSWEQNPWVWVVSFRRVTQ